nr:metallophosphoesterase family protein [Bradyrhizobium yuanmingense]
MIFTLTTWLFAVLADIRRHGVDHIVCLGDVATFGPSPQRAVELRVESNCLCIMGNHDALLLEPKLMRAYTQAVPVIDAINWCREQLTRDSFDYFASFKPTAELPLGLGSMLLYHGSPRSNVEDILATTPSEQLDTLFEERQAPVMAGGHAQRDMAICLHLQTDSMAPSRLPVLQRLTSKRCAPFV